VRSVPVASIKTLQCGSDHGIRTKFVAKFLLWGNRTKIINDDADGRKYDDAEPCLLVDI
jgi:hypothetical protein